MNSVEMRKSIGTVCEVTITKDKTLWMRLFRIPSSITYALRNSKWYNETYDRSARISEVERIEMEISLEEYAERHYRKIRHESE